MRRIYPKTIFSETNTIDQQIDHVLSEICEVIREKRGSLDFFHELADVQHTIETLWNVLDRIYGHDFTEKIIFERIEQKNRERGYYLE